MLSYVWAASSKQARSKSFTKPVCHFSPSGDRGTTHGLWNESTRGKREGRVRRRSSVRPPIHPSNRCPDGFLGSGRGGGPGDPNTRCSDINKGWFAVTHLYSLPPNLPWTRMTFAPRYAAESVHNYLKAIASFTHFSGIPNALDTMYSPVY